jgi:hypothetical protein
MPLDDHEQRILAEIERRFYEEDPDLAHKVRNIDRREQRGIRLPIAGIVVAALVILASFTSQTYVALAGFALLVVSATALVQALRARIGGSETSNASDIVDRIRRMRRFRRR